MWVHIVIFVIIFGCAAAWKAGWIRLEGLERQGIRWFFLVSAVGNLVGLTVTLNSGREKVYPPGYRFVREEGMESQAELMVSVDGSDAAPVRLYIPEKEDMSQEEAAVQKTDEKEELSRRLREAADQYNQERNDPDYYYLPPQWEGKPLQWSRPGESSGSLLAGLSLLAAMVLLLKSLKEKQEIRARRMEQQLLDYPGLVMKFTLLVQAGMTVRRAFMKMASDYGKKKKKEPRFAYEEIVTACHEMESGVSEMEVYRRFGERCGQIKYKTFATLLIQNLQKGSKYMGDMLEKESLEAWDERKRKARVLGEVAATRLLIPMVMMLGVVMAIVMIPAFLSL